jgi:aminoglycoside phosphotransferase (APT) family kinase protein
VNTILTREYSQRLGILSGEQLQAALSRFDLGLLLDAQPATAGLFGQNVFLTTTRGEYVLRGKPHYLWQFPKERYFARQIHEHTKVPAPWPYLIDPTTDIFGWSYALMPRLPGLILEDPEEQKRLSEEDSLSIAHALGETLAQLHDSGTAQASMTTVEGVMYSSRL